jgi:hypothetical protein
MSSWCLSASLNTSIESPLESHAGSLGSFPQAQGASSGIASRCAEFVTGKRRLLFIREQSPTGELQTPRFPCSQMNKSPRNDRTLNLGASASKGSFLDRFHTVGVIIIHVLGWACPAARRRAGTQRCVGQSCSLDPHFPVVKTYSWDFLNGWSHCGALNHSNIAGVIC